MTRWLATPAFHLTMTIIWALMIIPTALWWKDSILWVGLMSVYACVMGHWSSYQGSRAERAGGASDDPSSAGSAATAGTTS